MLILHVEKDLELVDLQRPRGQGGRQTMPLSTGHFLQLLGHLFRLCGLGFTAPPSTATSRIQAIGRSVTFDLRSC